MAWTLGSVRARPPHDNYLSESSVPANPGDYCIPNVFQEFVPRSTVIARGRGCYANVFTFRDLTYMDFIGTKFQGKQKHVLRFLEPLDDSDLRNPCGCLGADVLGLTEFNLLSVASVLSFFQ